MADLTAQRTLVKSPPELWSELSEVESLARHLGELGEIRITRVEPESTVAWEGEQISGTVELEQSGWGTKVTFHATVPEPDPALKASSEPAEPEPVAPVAIESEPVYVEPESEDAERDRAAVDEEATTVAEPAGEQGRGFLARWLFRRRRPPTDPVADETAPVAVVAEPVAVIEEQPIETPAVEVEPESIETDPAPMGSAAHPAAEDEAAEVGFDAARVQEILDGTLAALGQAHHRPFSRG